LTRRAVEAVRLKEKLSRFDALWTPHIVSRFNDCDVMVVKVRGEFVWHEHPETDDFFLVLDGRIRIETEEGDVTLEAGDLYVVPKGVSHRPVADEEAHVLLIEPRGTPNTGDPETAVVKKVI
jgi:mannose-6-phosphate isomerase-like protein (cupin superfamily)